VVAIGGIVSPERAELAARTGVAATCLVRALSPGHGAWAAQGEAWMRGQWVA
jgi:thiamine monophosphate synthase